MRAACVIVAVVAASAGCLRETSFRCGSNAECGALGTCEAEGYCSFPDSTCGAGEHRFADSAGPFASQCVGAVGGDGGLDGVAGCPADYTTLPGIAGHRYRPVIATTDWESHRAACAATSTSAYLAIPDDLAELQALATLSGATRFWIGVGDGTTEGTFTTVLGAMATFLPWQPPAPDNDGPGAENCVGAIAATAQLDDLKCNTKLVAVCECHP